MRKDDTRRTFAHDLIGLGIGYALYGSEYFLRLVRDGFDCMKSSVVQLSDILG